MRIGADGSYLRWQRDGMSRYLDGLLHSVEGLLPADDDLVVYYNSLDRQKLFAPTTRERAIRFPKATPWNQLRVPIALREDKCDVYLGGANIVPAYAPAPTVVVLHDCKPFRVPELVDPRWRIYLRVWLKRSVRHAAAVIVDSEWTAAECEHWFGVTPTRVVYPGVDPSFRPASAAEDVQEAEHLRTSLGLGAVPFVLQVGAFERHKGGDTAADAVDIIRGRGEDVMLVRCGRAGPVGGRSGVLDAGHVDDMTLRALYHRAAVVVVTSTHEGFGLPVVEAMASDTPVVAVRATALPEVGGDAAVYATPGDAGSVAAGLTTLLRDPGEVARRRAAGRLQATKFQWTTAGEAVLDVLRGVAKKR